MSDRPALHVAHAGGVATLTLDRPQVHNAFDDRLIAELTAALEAAGADPAVRAVVLTGSGRAFCAGQDLAEHAEALRADPAKALDTVREHYNPIVATLMTMPKPVIAAINGACAGAGLGLALACDLRIAAAGVRFVTAFTGVGLSFDSGVSVTLARAVGASRAAGLILLGEPFTAEQAAEWGLVHRVVPPEELAPAAAALAARLAEGPTAAYAEAKAALAAGWALPLEDALEAEAEAQVRLGVTADHREGVEAFLAKRQPRFTGR